MNEYNGHPSYEHWNVALWAGNDEWLYRFLLGFECSGEAAEIIMNDIHVCVMSPETPDGVEWTEELIRYAWRCVNEEA